MKNNKIKILIIVAMIALCSIGVFAGSKFFITHPDNGLNYVEEPQPVYIDNASKQQKDFVSDDKLLKKIAKTSSSRIKSSELKTWEKHLSDNKGSGKGNGKGTVILSEISPNRMVKVIKTEYPDGLETKAGFYANAVLTSVFDAETGNLLESTVTGDYKEETAPPRQSRLGLRK